MSKQDNDRDSDTTSPALDKSGKRQPENTLGVRAVLLSILDTSTRLFVPSVGGTVAGLWIDVSYDTRPWFTIIGVILGTLLAIFLVYAQIRAIDKEKEPLVRT